MTTYLQFLTPVVSPLLGGGRALPSPPLVAPALMRKNRSKALKTVTTPLLMARSVVAAALSQLDWIPDRMQDCRQHHLQER